jgi:hypothetical protein
MTALGCLLAGLLLVIVLVIGAAAWIDRANRKRHEANKALAEFVEQKPFRWNEHEGR